VSWAVEVSAGLALVAAFLNAAFGLCHFPGRLSLSVGCRASPTDPQGVSDGRT